jgi:hypothetical protein
LLGRTGGPSVLAGGKAIQRPYISSFGHLWECAAAVADDRVDWLREVGPACPICSQRDCWRRITPYQRTVIELFPYREERIQVARFQCRKTGRTFSLLPVWLAPYHQYTIASMLLALLLAAATEEHGIQSLFAVAEKLLEPDCRANGSLLGRWLRVCVSGLRRAHAELARWAPLGGIVSGRGDRGWLDEVSAYCQALGIRGPPNLDEVSGLDELLRRHARATARFLFGATSQDRAAHRHAISAGRG